MLPLLPLSYPSPFASKSYVFPIHFVSSSSYVHFLLPSALSSLSFPSLSCMCSRSLSLSRTLFSLYFSLARYHSLLPSSSCFSSYTARSHSFSVSFFLSLYLSLSSSFYFSLSHPTHTYTHICEHTFTHHNVYTHTHIDFRLHDVYANVPTMYQDRSRTSLSVRPHHVPEVDKCTCSARYTMVRPASEVEVSQRATLTALLMVI